jgi:putative membrane protein
MKKAIIVILSALGGFTAKAQIPQPDPDTTARHFLIVASIGNLQEASAGQLAVGKAKHADVRSFGQMMVMDHRRAEQQLMQLATRKGYNIPSEAAGGIQPDLNLKNATDNFDAIYIHAMLAGHGNTVQMFENYATTGKDPDVKAFAQQTLPTLKAHLAAVKALDEKYKQLSAK